MHTFMRRGLTLPRSFHLSSEDLPDPNVLPVESGYYIYSTNRPGVNVPVVFSPDLEDFTLLGDAMPVLPRWARRGLTWAPEVTGNEMDGYRLYFTARLKGSQAQVIGVAISARPEGPFISTDQPLIRMLDLGGAIDPAVLQSAGRTYLYWKNDGNAVGQPTHLWGAELSPDGLTLAGEPVALLAATESWEHQLVEAPQVIEEQGTYHLLYSCADFGNESYAIGHARGSSPLGPFDKTRQAPILASYGQVAGPGHSHAFRTNSGEWRLAYHGWEAGRCGYPKGRRALHLAPLQFEGSQPMVRPIEA